MAESPLKLKAGKHSYLVHAHTQQANNTYLNVRLVNKPLEMNLNEGGQISMKNHETKGNTQGPG